MSPGSCSPKRGLVPHQALLPAAGEPALPPSDQSGRESGAARSPQLHHACPSWSRSSARAPLACGRGGGVAWSPCPWRAWARGPAESDPAPRRTPVRGLNKQGPRCRGAGPGPVAESAACSSLANPSLPQRRRTVASGHVSRAALVLISKSGDRQPTERKSLLNTVDFSALRFFVNHALWNC